MHTKRGRSVGLKAVLSSAAGALVLGVTAVPAHAADTVRQEEWHLDAMQADQIWKISTGRGVTVAVIDSGVDKSIPDLRGQVVKGKDFSESKGDEYTDNDNHGTGVASLIAGDGNAGPATGYWGLAPGAKILPIRIPDGIEDLTKTSKGSDVEAAEAIRYAADSQAKIINMSFGSSYGNTPVLKDAVKYALAKGKLLFAAVGNEAQVGDPVEYPAATPGVVGVGALNQKAALWSHSETGPQVDISAPGLDIINACSGGTGLCKGSGTSFSSALVSASAALIWSKHPDWTNNQVLRVMLNTASGVGNGARHNDQVGYGAVRPLEALLHPGDPGPADVYPLPDLAASERSASASPSAKPSSDAGSGASKSPVATAASSRGSAGGGAGLWVGVGAAVLVVAGVVGFVVVRSRRRGVSVAGGPLLPPVAGPGYVGPGGPGAPGSPYGAYPQQHQPPPAYGPPPAAPPGPPGAPGQGPPYGP